MTDNAAVVARGVCFGYRAGTEVLTGVNLTLYAGGIAVLWGLNGSGKTTLGKILAGLLRPRAGEVRRAGRVGMVFATPEPLILGDTPYDDVRLGPAWAKLPADEVARRTTEALAAFGLTPKAETPCEELSLGEKKRVTLAAAFALAPAALILDEPFAFLDDVQAGELAEATKRFAVAGAAVLVLTGRRRGEGDYDRFFTLSAGVVKEEGGVSP